jgi:hypothetical protein
MSKPFAWIVPFCPDFYFMPVLRYHKIFREWDTESWDCPAYWSSKGFPVVPCYTTEDENAAECWISQDKYQRWSDQPNLKSFCTLPMWTENLNASRSVRKFIQLLTCDLSSPINRGPITGPPPIFKRR